MPSSKACGVRGPNVARKTAKALGLIIAQFILLEADRDIE